MTGLLRRFSGAMRSYGHHLSALACVLGFVLDATQLPSIEHPFTQYISFFYFALAGVALIIFQSVSAGKLRSAFFTRVEPFLPPIIQFVFGGLLSVVFVYYFRSAELGVSWPLIIILGALIAGNELIKKTTTRLEFQIAVLFLLFLFFSIFYIPLLTGSIGTLTFFFSVLLSSVVLAGFIVLLSLVAWGKIKETVRRLLLTVTGIAVLVIGLYFLNIIPPIPLVGKAANVYHSISRDSSGNYVGRSEQQNFLESSFFVFFPPTYHRTSGEAVYFFSAVFAPLQLHTPIKHVWQYKDANNTWVTSSEISFPLSGGRKEGYRGYSEKFVAQAGLWRVLVQTEDGRTISRKKFYIADVTKMPLLSQEIL